ncbi:MAG: fluoride efflux transporter CrcB [Paludibacteraceae bacterium]|nr:fluoride efflux transporter CrcB [Paludibacteraceae bacterium]
MFRSLLLVALGGALGSACRFLVSKCLPSSSFPWATLFVNLSGAFIIGLLLGLVARNSLSSPLRLLLITGFCGGFTTFSTFAAENLELMKTADILTAVLYSAASFFIGIFAVFLGSKLCSCL